MHDIVIDTSTGLDLMIVQRPHSVEVEGHAYVAWRGWFKSEHGPEVVFVTKKTDQEWDYVHINPEGPATMVKPMEIADIVKEAHDAYHAREINGREHVPNRQKLEQLLKNYLPTVEFTKAQAQMAGFSRSHVERVFKKFGWGEKVSPEEILDRFGDEFTSMFINDVIRRKEMGVVH